MAPTKLADPADTFRLMSVIGGLGQPAEDPLPAPKMAPTKLAAGTIGLDPGDDGFDRPMADPLLAPEVTTTKLADPADTIGLVPLGGFDRPAPGTGGGGGIRPMADPLLAPEMATTGLADPADAIGLVPDNFGLDRPAPALRDDFDMLIAEPQRAQGQPEAAPVDDVLGDVSVSLIERPEPMVVDLSEPIVVDAPEVAAALIDNQVVEIVEIVDNPSVDFDPMPDPIADSLIDELDDLMKEADDAASDITDNLKG